MRYGIVINRASGSGIFRSEEMLDRLREVFTENGHVADIRCVPPEDLDSTLEKVAASDADALIVGGGDGTVNAAASLLAGTGKALGIIPLGTFNLAARDLGIDLDPFEAAAQLIDAEPSRIDLLTVNNHYCLCACVIGFYPALANAREDFHGRSWWTKSLRLVREIATVAVKSPALELEITTAGGKSRHLTRLAAFAPGRIVESPGLIPQRDHLSSGKLSAYVAEHLTRLQMLGAACRYLTGTLFKTEGMKHLTGTRITVNVRRRKSLPTMIDGEIKSIETPYVLEIHPQALNVLRPEKPAT